MESEQEVVASGGQQIERREISRPYGDIERIARGLGRSTIVGRHENGLPITTLAAELDAIMLANRLRAEASDS